MATRNGSLQARGALLDTADLYCRMAQSDIAERIDAAASRFVRAFKSGRKILAFGNGGSAADAQHLVCELVGRFMKERRALAAIALCTNDSNLTCLGNDYGYKKIFERQTEALGKRGDILFAISTSGNSENVNRALKAGRRLGLYAIGLSGKTGGAMSRLLDLEIRVPHSLTPRIQEAHVAILHNICALVDQRL